jgi:hypothetical protein
MLVDKENADGIPIELTSIADGRPVPTAIVDGKLLETVIPEGRLLDIAIGLGNEEFTVIAVGKPTDPIFIGVGNELDRAISALKSAKASNTVVSESRSVGRLAFKDAILLCNNCTAAYRITP